MVLPMPIEHDVCFAGGRDLERPENLPNCLPVRLRDPVDTLISCADGSLDVLERRP